MNDHGSPAQVQPGVVVRLRITGSVIYASKRMTRDEAIEVAQRVREKLRGSTTLVDLPEFPCAEPPLEHLSVLPGRVVAVEVRCVTGDGALVRLPAAETVQTGPPSGTGTGTAWLRQRTTAERVPLDGPR